jgi:hypothetical protein
MWNVSGALGKSFFIAGLLPALAFFAAIDLVFVPPFTDGWHLVDIEYLAITGVIYILGGTFLGFLLLSLNTPIIKLYENGLILSSWLRQRNQQWHSQRYPALTARREAYRQAAEKGQDLEEAIAKLEAAYEKVEALENRQTLPLDVEHVMPTALGNVFAVVEEYPWERYGMDAMVYWPRLTAVIPDDFKSQIADLKTTLDFLLNLSLLAIFFGLGSIGIALWFGTILELVYGLFALMIAYGLYRLAIGSARELGEIVMSSFDLFRGPLREKCGLPKPTSLIAEQRLWRLLASFVQRGEEFYYPIELTLEDSHALLQQELGHHTHNLCKLRERADLYVAGGTPLHLLNQIETERQVIEEIKARLAGPR